MSGENTGAGGWAARLSACGQDELLGHLQSLPAESRARLEAELLATDLDVLARLVRELSCPPAPPSGPVEPVPVIQKGADPATDSIARDAGMEMLKAGQVAALVVAGGQGSRLGHPGPKGTFPASPIRKKTLFQLFAEQVFAISRQTQRKLPLYVMTSEENHKPTIDFFVASKNFGLDPDQITFFTQGMLPAVDAKGKLVLREQDALFRSPNGHGGTLLALEQSGSLDDMERRGVSDIFYFQVDNPLVEIADPVFLGYHRLRRSEFSSKVVPKSGPEEKVGVLVKRGGRLEVIEYSDLDPQLRQATNPDGSLKFSAGSIAIHAISAAFVRRVTAGGCMLPFHVARKKLKVFRPGSPAEEIEGVKFETFIFDALQFAKNAIAVEVVREFEFAPIKNATGPDSIATSTDLQSRRAAAWFDAAKMRVERGNDGAPKAPIEISPLFAHNKERFVEQVWGESARFKRVQDFSAPIYIGGE